MFVAFHHSLDIARTLKPVIDRLKTRDADLARQIRRAAASISLNLLEGSKRAGKDRLHSYRIAAGSCAEVRAALALAAAWGDLAATDVARCDALLDRQAALLHGLTNPGR